MNFRQELFLWQNMGYDRAPSHGFTRRCLTRIKSEFLTNDTLSCYFHDLLRHTLLRSGSILDMSFHSLRETRAHHPRCQELNLPPWLGVRHFEEAERGARDMEGLLTQDWCDWVAVRQRNSLYVPSIAVPACSESINICI